MRFHEATGYLAEVVRPVLADVDDDVVEELVRLVEDAQNVVIFGRGRSGLVGRGLAIRLVHLGIPTFVVGETITPPVHEDDLVILLSGSGETFSVVVTGQVAKGLGCRIVTITANRGSTLGGLADHVVELTLPEDVDHRPELAPLGTLFEDAAALFCDGLVAELMDRRDATEDDMRARHATLE